MIRQQNADTMVLASVHAYGRYSPLDDRHFEYYQGSECLSQAHWLGPWCQHSDDELRLRQNHQEVGASV